MKCSFVVILIKYIHKVFFRFERSKTMNVLVINCGSSSLKFQLIDAETENLIAKGLCERIGIEGSKLNHTPNGGEKVVIEFLIV